VHLDLERIRSLSVDVLSALTDEELAVRVGVRVELAPALRGAHDLNEARTLAAAVLNPPRNNVVLTDRDRETLERFRELRERGGGGLAKDEAKALIREVKAVGGHLRAIRRALTGADSGPELWTILAALPQDETLRRLDAAL
jgi:hypothetical protein